jgi:hypothetical protein
MISEAEWRLLTLLYAAGNHGVEYHGHSYGAVSWSVLVGLRDHNPPLAREITRLDPRHHTTHYFVIITDAGERFYERSRQRYNVLYPP